MAMGKQFGTVELIAPPSEREAICHLLADVSDFLHELYFILPRKTYSRVYRMRSSGHLMESMRDAERSIGVRSPRSKVIPTHHEQA